MLTNIQPRHESDSNFCMLSLQHADSHGQTVLAVFRGGKSLTIEPATRLEEVERNYRTVFGFEEPEPLQVPRWRSKVEALADEVANAA